MAASRLSSLLLATRPWPATMSSQTALGRHSSYIYNLHLITCTALAVLVHRVNWARCHFVCSCSVASKPWHLDSCSSRSWAELHSSSCLAATSYATQQPMVAATVHLVCVLTTSLLAQINHAMQWFVSCICSCSGVSLGSILQDISVSHYCWQLTFRTSPALSAQLPTEPTIWAISGV